MLNIFKPVMKTTIILLIALSNGILYSQEKKLEWNKMTCETGIEKAQKHFNQGYYYCESFAYSSDKEPEFSKFYDEYLETKYHIFTLSGGCIMSDYRTCYREKMEKLLIEKYGSDIRERLEKEARELYALKKY